jgi:hypothetical protein
MSINLTEYHNKRQTLTDADIAERLLWKETELKQIFSVAKPEFLSEIIKVAVLGCADRRLVPGHKEIFQKLLGKKVDITTFDITLEHLQGAENVVKHDCALPLPGQPYNITYDQLLVKFMPPEKQWEVLMNAYNALASGGIAIHLMYINGKARKDTQQFYDVPLEDFLSKLTSANIPHQKFQVKTGTNLEYEMTALILRK